MYNVGPSYTTIAPRKSMIHNMVAGYLSFMHKTVHTAEEYQAYSTRTTTLPVLVVFLGAAKNSQFYTPIPGEAQTN